MQQAYLSSHKAQQRGFTLTELIMVIVMLGILAVFAAPRMFNSGDFYARGFHDETLALLRYAQKTAIAQRRTVCVTFTTNSADLAIASEPATYTCNTALIGPRGEPAAHIPSTGHGVTYNDGTPANWNFNFDGLGQPISASGALLGIRTILITNASTVFVEAVTGYVHD